jgi:hypothetical protein
VRGDTGSARVLRRAADAGGNRASEIGPRLSAHGGLMRATILNSARRRAGLSHRRTESTEVRTHRGRRPDNERAQPPRRQALRSAVAATYSCGSVCVGYANAAGQRTDRRRRTWRADTRAGAHRRALCRRSAAHACVAHGGDGSARRHMR